MVYKVERRTIKSTRTKKSKSNKKLDILVGYPSVWSLWNKIIDKENAEKAAGENVILENEDCEMAENAAQSTTQSTTELQMQVPNPISQVPQTSKELSSVPFTQTPIEETMIMDSQPCEQILKEMAQVPDVISPMSSLSECILSEDVSSQIQNSRRSSQIERKIFETIAQIHNTTSQPPTEEAIIMDSQPLMVPDVISPMSSLNDCISSQTQISSIDTQTCKKVINEMVQVPDMISDLSSLSGCSSSKEAETQLPSRTISTLSDMSTLSECSLSKKRYSFKTLNLNYNESWKKGARPENKHVWNRIKRFNRRKARKERKHEDNTQKVRKEMADLQIDNDRLRVEIRQYKQRFIAKSGEASILWIHLRDAKSRVSMLQRDLMKRQESTKKEWNEMMAKIRAITRK